MPNTKLANNRLKFNCEKCDYSCSKQSDFNKHLSTRKHQILINPNNFSPKVAKVYNCDCGRKYKHMSSLCNHKRTCKTHKENDDNQLFDIPPTNEDPLNEAQTNAATILDNPSLVVELLKQNKEFKDLILEERREFQQIIKEMSKNMGNTVNNNNNTNINSNNKFNLNVFLNEKCKNAMTLKDFVKSINISIQDFIETGERGFIDGISNIIVERINEMEIHDRPLHCTDLKREIVYIKDDDKWEKDEDKVHLRKAVKGVANKNERMRPIWYDSTPDVGIMGTENYEKFFKYSESSLGGCGKEETRLFEDKVMKNVLREVTIDKTKALE